MKFKTSITEIADGKEMVRGKSLEDLVESKSFTHTIYLLLTGKEPNEKEERMLDAIFVSVIDHGPATASAMSARISASAKNPMHASLAAGLLSLGDRHGVAVTGAMQFFLEAKEIENIDTHVATLKNAKVRIPGYGHRVFTDYDPRARTLLKMATDQGVYGEHCVLALGVHAALNKISSKELPLNVDGAIAAILCDMGFDPVLGNAIFMIGRVPGLLAHIAEEIQNDQGIRRLSNDDVEFVS